MKQILIVLLVFVLMPYALVAQAKKLPSEPTIFTWPYAVADEPKISGFRLKSSPVQSGPFTNVVTSVSPSLRTLTIPAAFSTGSVMIFYVVVPYFTTGGQTVEAGDSNSVEVDLAVPSVTGLQVK